MLSSRATCSHFGGNARRELYRLEHGTQPEGQTPSDKTFGGGEDEFDAFVSGTGGGEHVPSAAFVDLEVTVGSAHWHLQAAPVLRAADLRKGGRSRHFQRGHFSIGEEIVDRVLDRTRNRVYRTFMERLNSLGLLLDSASQLCSGGDYVQLRDISRLSSKWSNPLVDSLCSMKLCPTS